jgi:uncharacterized membrane protein HdeD (DUF308 family)
VIYFIGGSLGSLVGAQAWGLAGWPGVCAIGIILALAGIIFLYAPPSKRYRTRLSPRG